MSIFLWLRGDLFPQQNKILFIEEMYVIFFGRKELLQASNDQNEKGNVLM